MARSEVAPSLAYPSPLGVRGSRLHTQKEIIIHLHGVDKLWPA